MTPPCEKPRRPTDAASPRTSSTQSQTASALASTSPWSRLSTPSIVNHEYPGIGNRGGERGPHGGDDERGGQVRHEPEQVALVRAVPVQQHEQRAVAALLGGRGPQDDVGPLGDS